MPAVGVLTAIAGIFFVAPRKGDRSGMTAINRGFFLSAIFSLVLVVDRLVRLPAGLVPQARQSGITNQGILHHSGDPRIFAIIAVVIGLVLASAIQLLTGYFTETNRRPVMEIADSARTGAATVILSGISVGLESAVYSALLIGAAVYGAFLLGGGNATLALFAVALAGTGLLTTVGVIVSMDTFGPVSDNAQGIAEMSGDVQGEAAQVLTRLDAVGNTTKAITKGIAIATAVLAATALFGAFRTTVESALGHAAGTFSLSIDRPNALVGLIVGAAVVFYFSGLAIMAVGRAAGRVVFEVREQFRTHPGIMDFTEKPEYGRVVDICTRDSLRELATPGLLAVLTPIVIGFGFGYVPLGSFLAGAIAAGVLMAVFLANSGGAWDNAKKLVEDGIHGGKGSEAHAATVIGDTVGDPFKDTAGPAINPLIKVMNLVSLLIATSVVKYAGNHGLRAGVAIGAFAIVVGSIVIAKRRATGIAPSESGSAGRPGAPAPSDDNDEETPDRRPNEPSRAPNRASATGWRPARVGLSSAAAVRDDGSHGSATAAHRHAACQGRRATRRTRLRACAAAARPQERRVGRRVAGRSGPATGSGAVLEGEAGQADLAVRERPAWPVQPEVIIDARLYEADAGDLLEHLRRDRPAGHAALMYVGHNPAAAEVTEILVAAPVDFPTSAIAVIDLTADWPDIVGGDGQLVASWTPQAQA